MSNIGDIWLRLLLDDADFEKQVVTRAQKAGDKAGLSMGQQLAAGLSKGATQIGQTLAGIGQNLTKTGSAMTRNLTLPLVAAGAAVTHFALDFDTTLRRVVGLTDVTGAEIDGIREKILALGPAVGKGPQELGEAFYFIASAGFKADEAMEVLEVSAKASASGLGETQTIAQVLGGVINAYGRENITAARAADILTEAVSQGTAEASGMASVLGTVVPAAAALGVSFDQVSAALAGMTLTGLGVEESATSLTQIFSSLLKPTVQAEAALEEMGLSSAELRRQLREEGLLATLRTLEERFAGNETAAAAVFGNIRALRGVTALLTLDNEQLNAVFAKVENSLGRQAEAYKDTEGPQREMDRAMAELQATAIELGADVLPTVVEVLTQIAAGAKEVAKWWKSLDEDTRQQIVQWLAWVAVAGPVLLLVGKLATGLGALFKAVGVLLGSKGIGALAGATGRAKLLMLGWVGVVLAATAALEAATPAVSDFFDTLIAGKKANKVLHDLNDLTGDMLKANVLRTMGISAKQFAKAIERAGGSVEDAFQAILDSGGDFGKALDKLSADSDTAGGLFGGWGDRSPAAIKAALEKGRQIAAEKAGEIPKVVSAKLEEGQWQVEQAAEAIPDPILEALEKAKQDVADAANDLIHTLATTLASDPQELRDAAKAMWDEIMHPFPDLKRRLKIEGILSQQWLIKGLTSPDSKVRADTAEYIKGLLAEYELLAPGALAAGEELNPALQAGIEKTFGALTTYLKTITGDIVDAFELADEFDRMGFGSLAGWLRGFTRAADLAQLNRVMAPFRDFIEAKLAFSGSPPFTHSRELGEGVGESWTDALMTRVKGAIPTLTAALGEIGGAMTLSPSLTLPAMPGAAAGVPASLPAQGDTVINYNLTVGGVPYEFKTRDDFIKALDDVARFGGGDGRLGGG